MQMLSMLACQAQRQISSLYLMQKHMKEGDGASMDEQAIDE